MKPMPPRQFLYGLQGQSTSFHLRIVDLNKSKSQMFLRLFGRLLHVNDPKYLMELAP